MYVTLGCSSVLRMKPMPIADGEKIEKEKRKEKKALKEKKVIKKHNIFRLRKLLRKASMLYPSMLIMDKCPPKYLAYDQLIGNLCPKLIDLL